MLSLFKAVADAQQAKLVTQHLEGRVVGQVWGTVVDNNDPLKLGRVRVVTASDPLNWTDWLVKVQPFGSLSTPLPDLGDTVLVSFINGDVHHGAYCGTAQNTVNPADTDQTRFVYKLGTDAVPAVSAFEQAATVFQVGDATVNVQNQEVSLGTSGGAYPCSVTITDTGVTLSAGVSTVSLVQGVLTLTNVVVNVNNTGVTGTAPAVNLTTPALNVQITSGGSASINGNQIATTGAVDTRGDSLTSKGWS